MAVATAVAAVSVAVATTTIATVAAAVVAVSAAVGMVGLAVSAVGMVTGNKDLLKAGKIMGYVGLAGAAAGGVAGGVNTAMEVGLKEGLSPLEQMGNVLGNFGEGFSQTVSHAANPEGFKQELLGKEITKGATQEYLGGQIVDNSLRSGVATPDAAAVMGGVPGQTPMTGVELKDAYGVGTGDYQSVQSLGGNQATTGAAVPTTSTPQVSVSTSTPATSSALDGGAQASTRVGNLSLPTYNSSPYSVPTSPTLVPTNTPPTGSGFMNYLKENPVVGLAGAAALGPIGSALGGILNAQTIEEQNKLKADEIDIARRRQILAEQQQAQNMRPMTPLSFQGTSYKGPAGILNT